MGLEELKKEFLLKSKKYKMPEFNELNECFEIDRIDRDTDYVLREIRKTMMDKIVGYIKFMEMMINPSQAPPMFMMFLKSVTPDEKKIIQGVYRNFVELELESLKLEVEYSEESEAKSIKKIFEIWHKTKPDLNSAISVMEKNWNSNSGNKSKSYFG